MRRIPSNERREACQEYADFIGEPIEKLFPEFKPRQMIEHSFADTLRRQYRHGYGLPVVGHTTGGSTSRK